MPGQVQWQCFKGQAWRRRSSPLWHSACCHRTACRYHLNLPGYPMSCIPRTCNCESFCRLRNLACCADVMLKWRSTVRTLWLTLLTCRATTVGNSVCRCLPTEVEHGMPRIWQKGIQQPAASRR